MKKLIGTLAISGIIIHSSAMANNQTFQNTKYTKQEISGILLVENKTPMYSSETKKEISQEARQLIEDLKETLNHTGKLTKKIWTPIVNKINNWIKKNYDKLPEAKKEKIRNFVAEVKLDFKASLWFFKKMFKDFLKIRKDIEKWNKNNSYNKEKIDIRKVA